MKSTRTETALAALFWVPLALAALWIVLWPPHTVDGPAHLLGGRALSERTNSSWPYFVYYDYDWFPTPNLAGTGLVGELVGLGGLRFAATTMLLLAALGLPLGLRYAIRAVRLESSWLAIAGLPLCFGYLFFYGFWNYCIGIALALVCVGLTLRTAPEWSLRPTAALAALFSLTWLTHLVPFAAAALFLAAVVVTGRSRRGWIAAGAVLVPGALLSVAYLLHTDSGDAPTWTNPVGRTIGLVSLHTTITTFSRWEDVIAAAVAVVLVALAVRAGRRVPAPGAPASSAAAGWATLAAAVLVLVVPTNFGIDFGLIDERLAVFPVLFGIVWLAARPPEPRVALAAATALVVATGGLAAVRIGDLRHYDDLAEEYASAGRFVDEGSILVALRFARYGPDAGRNSSWDPTRHLASRLAAERYSIDVGHYEAVLDYFPARFAEPNLRRAIDASLAGLDKVPPVVGLPTYSSRCLPMVVPPTARRIGTELGFVEPSEEFVAANPIRYVLLVGSPDAGEGAVRAVARIRKTLRCDYEQIGVTAPRGLVEVWRLRDAR